MSSSLLRGLVPDRDSVSSKAKSVWNFYKKNRPDVQNKPLDDGDNPKTPSPEDDSVLHPGGKRNSLNYAYFIRRGPGTTKLKSNHKVAMKQLRKWAIHDYHLGDIAQMFFNRYYGY